MRVVVDRVNGSAGVGRDRDVSVGLPGETPGAIALDRERGTGRDEEKLILEVFVFHSECGCMREESSEGRKGRVYKVVWKLEEQLLFLTTGKKKQLVFIATENIHIQVS